MMDFERYAAEKAEFYGNSAVALLQPVGAEGEAVRTEATAFAMGLAGAAVSALVGAGMRPEIAAAYVQQLAAMTAHDIAEGEGK